MHILIIFFSKRFASINDPKNWSSNFRHVADNWELTVKIFSPKRGKDNERAISSFSYVSEAIKKVLKSSPCMYVCVV